MINYQSDYYYIRWYDCLFTYLIYILDRKVDLLSTIPVEEHSFEVLEESVLVLINEPIDPVVDLTRVVEDTEVPSKLQRLVRLVQLAIT